MENIRRIPADAIIVLSDEISSDDTAQQIEASLPGDARIRVRMRHGLTGFHHHCNALIAECDTELFSFLPHDDLIAPGYYDELIAALDNESTAGIAFGRVIAERRGRTYTSLPELPKWVGTFETWMEAVLLANVWNLGIAYRGVIRREVLSAMPAPTPGYAYVDELWVFRMALCNRILEVPSTRYHKRYYSTSTHRAKDWTITPGGQKARLSAAIRDVLDDDTGSRAQMFLEAVWQLGHGGIHDSRSWRWTAPLRSVARLAHLARDHVGV